jgi:excinuclease ABC subunit C
VPIPIDYPEANVQVTVPKGGDRKKLLDLSEKNADYFIEEIKNKERLKLFRKVDQVKILEKLQEDLQ